MKEKTVSGCTELKNIIDGIGTVQTAWGLIVTGALVLAFAFCVKMHMMLTLKMFLFL